ncbi:MAG TPA: hypothetical protein VGY57_16000 [Vicinamibacterales bacterium]|nr:hypothetical protein [Vicinamibacterales bacterium]
MKGRALTLLIAAAFVATLDARAPQSPSAVQRFLARGDSPPVAYRALRHLEAHNTHFGAHAWLDAWTEFDEAHGFRYQVIQESGNAYVRSRVLRAALDGEQKMWASREPQRASLTSDNYHFQDGGRAAEGLAAVGIKPKRKDVLLVEGAIFLEPDDGELTRIEGKLSKAPSIWTRRVDIVRRYERLAGVRVPMSIESTAHVLIAGKSTFKMTYQYETINGQHIGNPQPPHGTPFTTH